MLKKPSGWTNLQDYLGVNEDQGQAMAQHVTSDIAQTGRDARRRLSNGQRQIDDASREAGRAGAWGTPTTSQQIGRAHV